MLCRVRVCIDIQAAVAQRAGVGRYTKMLAEHLEPQAAGDALAITFRDGDVAVTVDGAETKAKKKPRAKRKSRAFTKGKAANGGQGSLF